MSRSYYRGANSLALHLLRNVSHHIWTEFHHVATVARHHEGADLEDETGRRHVVGVEEVGTISTRIDRARIAGQGRQCEADPDLSNARFHAPHLHDLEAGGARAIGSVTLRQRGEDAGRLATAATIVTAIVVAVVAEVHRGGEDEHGLDDCNDKGSSVAGSHVKYTKMNQVRKLQLVNALLRGTCDLFCRIERIRSDWMRVELKPGIQPLNSCSINL